nr:hypothetical protein [Micromonospora sp. DSM 115978]
MATNELIDVDLVDPALYRNGMPYDLYADLRRRGPVLRHPRAYVPASDTEVEFWAVLGHKEVQAANRDWETFSADEGPSLVPFPPERRGIVMPAMDPPKHSVMRRLVSAGFTPRMIARHRRHHRHPRGRPDPRLPDHGFPDSSDGPGREGRN